MNKPDDKKLNKMVIATATSFLAGVIVFALLSPGLINLLSNMTTNEAVIKSDYAEEARVAEEGLVEYLELMLLKYQAISGMNALKDNNSRGATEAELDWVNRAIELLPELKSTVDVIIDPLNTSHLEKIYIEVIRLSDKAISDNKKEYSSQATSSQ